jgi:hypothetical protein
MPKMTGGISIYLENNPLAWIGHCNTLYLFFLPAGILFVSVPLRGSVIATGYQLTNVRGSGEFVSVPLRGSVIATLLLGGFA